MLLSIIIFFTFGKYFYGKDLTDCNPKILNHRLTVLKMLKQFGLLKFIGSFILQLCLKNPNKTNNEWHIYLLQRVYLRDTQIR